MSRTMAFAGDLEPELAATMEAALASAGAGADGVTVDLSELDVVDGPALARAASALRSLARRTPLLIVGAPQILAHTLYRVGALEGPHAIRLSDTREEEPYG